MPTDGTGASTLDDTDRGRLPLPELQAGDSDLLRGAGDGPAAGSREDERSTLARAAALRFPDLKDKQPRERVSLLLDYIADTAIARGELEETRLAAHVDLFQAREALDSATTGVTRSTKAAVAEAKRRARPDQARVVDGARWLVDRCTEQINRLDRDYDAASRAYTLVSGS